MTLQRLSRQELIRRNRRSGFVGRHGELATLKEALRRPPEEAVQFLFHIRGPGGVGKSTLVRQMESAARDAEAITAYVDESVADVVEAMEAVSAQFAQQGLAMKAFDKRVGTYRQRRHEADASAAATAPMAGDSAGTLNQETPSPSSVVASQLGLIGLGMIPGVGAFTGAVDPQQVAAGASQLKAMLSTRFSNRDDVQLVLSPLQELTPLFLQDLSEIAQRRSWVVLFFDTYERTGTLLNSWLRDVLLSGRYGELPANVLAVMAGQSRLEEQYWGDFVDLIADLPLEVFTETEARQLLTSKGVTNEQVIEVILQLSRRLPVLVSTLAESRPTSVEEVGDPSGTAVERFLKWETNPARRAAALACALPQELDEDIFRAAVDEEAAGLFGWLQSMPFVNYRAGHCRYHDVVRAAMLSLQRQQSPLNWQKQHRRLAETFHQRRIQLEDGASPEISWWDDDQWRNYQIQEIYHQICANPRTALPIALRVLIDAYEHGVNTARRWAQTLVKAGVDADASTVGNWGDKFLHVLEEERAVDTKFLTLALTCGELDNQGRAHAYILRGRNQRNSEKYDQALNDYAAALSLDPDAERAYHGRALTYHLMGRFDDAVNDYDHAIELNPAKANLFTYRGLSYFFMGRFDDALADFDRALELVPDNALAQTTRGLTYHSMERYDDAIADFDRAIELDPDNAWAHTSRGMTFDSMERYD
ncbi:tetratricopeptide repeat protein, partial [Streptomyces sp. NPDC058321]|uniref:tetratricopeptide repeat protein n=1 Tax=Streptomyces sp. NPDC058321 TaxID=3346445 RepID=UPI0036F0FF8B